MVLLHKVDYSSTIKELRPISLCNVLYRVVAKVLAKGRSIVDNIYVAFEFIHRVKTKHNVKFEDVTLKIDISKAYDRVDKGYLEGHAVEAWIS